ncbi:MAG: DNA polymerase, partial [Planctomycetota bacterium]
MHHSSATAERSTVDWLFLDMNAYFASVEQQRQPHLRGRPVAVVPTMTDRTCCIAVSYEARPFGVKTGVNVGLAKQLCPDLQLVEGRHEHYIETHHQILKAVESVLPIEKVCSIDEMVCPLAPPDRCPERAEQKGHAVKQAIFDQVGPHLRCSVGLAPNRFLAKVASNLQKPNGLSIITRAHLPYRLHSLKLTDLPGIGRNMQRRLANRGVTCTRQLCSLSKPAMRELWNSVLGEQWWHWLRGDEIGEKPTKRQTIGHSHVLAPALRTDDGARAVLVRLLHKAAARLRKEGYSARHLAVQVRYLGEAPRWSVRVPVGYTHDTPTLLRALITAWDARPPGGIPLQAGVTLLGLQRTSTLSMPLFAEDQQALQAAETMDDINKK